MTCVMLGGSRRVPRLPDDVRQRVDRIIQRAFRVVVGDANGADKAFQKYLADRGYRHVEVFAAGRPRNNVGGWPCRVVETQARAGTFDFYAAKDRAMAAEATVGFMLWDGASVGTALNVWRLVRQRKASLVYLQGERRFVEVRTDEDWQRLVALAGTAARADILKRLRGEAVPAPARELPLLEGLESAGLA